MFHIKNPLNKNKVFALLPVYERAVVTSGNYEKYIEFDGILYSHIIDPRTGYPSSGILSVTIFTLTAELADALATSVFVMGVEIGLNFINQLKGVECIIVDSENNILNCSKQFSCALTNIQSVSFRITQSITSLSDNISIICLTAFKITVSRVI